MKVNKPLWLASSAALAALAFGIWHSQQTPSDLPPPAIDAAQADGPAAPETPQETPLSAESPMTETEREAAFIRDIRQRFSPHMHIQHAQIRFLEQLISYLKAHYPDDWQQRVHTLLQASFPGMSDALMAKYESLQRYNEWLLADRQALQQMSPAERRKILWDKRYAAFGTDAEAIWAAEIRNFKIQEALDNVASKSEGTLIEQAESIVSAVRDTYGENSDNFLSSRQTELVNKFLGLPNVQDNLRALPAKDRRQAMRNVRATLGMDAAALDRWEALDSARDNVWSVGSDYMSERERIVTQYEGSAKTRELYALQKQVFGDEAEQIRREEESGFYRFDRERRIGRE